MMKLINFTCDCTSLTRAPQSVGSADAPPPPHLQDHAAPAQTSDLLQELDETPQTLISLISAGVMSPRASSSSCDAGEPRRVVPRRNAHLGEQNDSAALETTDPDVNMCSKC